MYNKEQFPHIALIAKAEIKKKEFSADLNNVISTFDKRYENWAKLNFKKYEEGEDLQVRSFQSYLSESTLIAQHIYDYFVEESEQVDDPTLKDMVEGVKDALEGEGDDNSEPAKPVDKPPVDTTPKPPVDTPPAPDPAPAPDPVKDPEETYSSEGEKILAKMFKAGVVSGITKPMLKAEGFDTSWYGDLESTGQRCGKYRLVGRNSIYNLEKV